MELTAVQTISAGMAVLFLAFLCAPIEQWCWRRRGR